MDLLANDLTALITLIASILGVVAGVLQLLKKSDDMTLRDFLKNLSYNQKLQLKKT